MRLDRFLSESAGRLGQKAAVVTGDVRHSYAELDRKSDRLAAALVGRGMIAGDGVVVFMDSGFEAVVSIFAVLKAGGVVVPIDPASGADELAFVFDHCRALAIVTQARLASVAAAAMNMASTVRLVVLAGGDRVSRGESCLSFEEVVNRLGPAPAPAVSGDDDDLAVLVYATIAVGMVEPMAMTRRQVVAAVAAQPLAGCDEVVVLRAPSIAAARSLYRLMAALQVGATVVLERGVARARHDSVAGGHLDDRAAHNWPPAPIVSWDGQRRPTRRHRVDWQGKRQWRG